MQHAGGPNPYKVAIIMEELGVPYEYKLHDFSSMKSEAFLKLNPNGRVPAIEDPNTGIVLFESGAIIEYLIDTYDNEKKLTYDSFPEKYQLKSWLHFQMSGQGPYFGQGVWFKHFHKENLPSAIERYQNEAKRIFGVLDLHLGRNKTPYLLGDKATYADLAFVPWLWYRERLFGELPDPTPDFPHFAAWAERLMARPSVQKMHALLKKNTGQ
ncbi:glutathione S-transferase [Lineolata rhizophorae]|uniref:Glutathione S-transferase n=1 Tax=Lineolata rhizophorae TaxID=578093 RepID=A0A6A6NWY1_9PEZI|nr:glutathione S-transferase [Lineolata rhizophorae]